MGFRPVISLYNALHTYNIEALYLGKVKKPSNVKNMSKKPYILPSIGSFSLYKISYIGPCRTLIIIRIDKYIWP
jgi:hypothetical protein